MSFSESLTSGPISRKRRTLIYGVHGCGKSTWASKWKNPVFISTENGTDDLDVTRTPLLTTSQQVSDALRGAYESDFDTVVIDSIGGLEKIIQRELDEEGFQQGYGKGTLEIDSRIARLLAILDRIVAAGKDVIVIGHAEITTVMQPDGTSWSQYGLKMSKRASASICEWADEVLFCQHIVAAQSKEVGMKRVNVAIDMNRRVLYTSGSTAFTAKTRKGTLKQQYNLDDVSRYLTDLGSN